MSKQYRVYIRSRTISDARSIIKLNPDVALACDAYTEQGFVTNDPEQARALKRALQMCINYAYETERVARRNTFGRHQTDKLSEEWIDVRAVIEPDPDASRLMR